MSKSRGLFVVFAGFFVCVGPSLGCSGDTGSNKNVAAQQFWMTFESQGYTDLPSVRAALTAELALHPGDAETTLLFAHANLWTLSEFGRTPPPVGDPGELPARATEALESFTAAGQLAPDDRRIDGWLASMEIAIGNFTSNAALIASGEARLTAGVEAYPEFNGFVRGLIGGQLPVTDPRFTAAEDAMWLTLDRCAGTTVDREKPDVTPYLPRRTKTGPQRVCWNPDKAPHNFEGFFLYMGDLAVKAGKVEQATQLYGNAKLAEDYAGWPLASELEARLATLAERRALYNDADPNNDPLLAVQSATSCAMCHARR